MEQELPEWTEDDRKVRLVEEMQCRGVLGPCLRAVGVSRAEAEAWLADEEFRQALSRATADAVDDGEAQMRRRGMGFREPIFDKDGQPVYKRCHETGEHLVDDNFDLIPMTKPVYDRQLLQAWLAAMDPGRFGDVRRLEVTGRDGGPVTTVINMVGVAASEEGPGDDDKA